MTIDFNQLTELLAAIGATDIAELTLKSGDFELTVRKGIPAMPTNSSAAVGIPTPPAVMPAMPATETEIPASSAAATASPTIDKKWVDVKSPMVGTFYRAPAPDEAPFVEVGSRIASGQPVCIIEAMKLMNEIEAETSGQVMEIVVENGQPVEYGQTLMRINPEG